ncbi:galactose-specific lectin nattectin-like [Synchiropus splendidus]|uniref:galactose-specific lectin nattectin-like n=1 Tax=Synchiropus splendidus TaxID=270530 RepID=UPI00237DD856|nr:galactose-specific lectin nattectin-like [Synchiropus splendidus]
MAGSSCCPAGWTRLWNRCFMYHRRPKSWTDAEKACIRLGGNLASIRGTVENRFVKKMVNRVTYSNKPIWIGGFDSASEGIWLWSDGARFYNYPWAKKVKKNKLEQCLLFNLIGTYWKDQKCEKKFSYVCSMTLK